MNMHTPIKTRESGSRTSAHTIALSLSPDIRIAYLKWRDARSATVGCRGKSEDEVARLCEVEHEAARELSIVQARTAGDILAKIMPAVLLERGGLGDDPLFSTSLPEVDQYAATTVWRAVVEDLRCCFDQHGGLPVARPEQTSPSPEAGSDLLPKSSDAFVQAFLAAHREMRRVEEPPAGSEYSYQAAVNAIEGAKGRGFEIGVHSAEQAALVALLAYEEIDLIDGGQYRAPLEKIDPDEHQALMKLKTAMRVLWRYFDKSGSATSLREYAQFIGAPDTLDENRWERHEA